MRIRILSAAACLSLVLLGASLAQQVGLGPKPEDRPIPDQPSSNVAQKPAPDNAPTVASLRSQLVQFRAEVELLELEHEADVDYLKAIATEVRQSNDVEKLKGVVSSLIPEIEKLKASEIEPSALKELETAHLMNSATARIARQMHDKMKKEFLRTTAELNEKKLQLIDLEKRYQAVTGK